MEAPAKPNPNRLRFTYTHTIYTRLYLQSAHIFKLIITATHTHTIKQHSTIKHYTHIKVLVYYIYKWKTCTEAPPRIECECTDANTQSLFTSGGRSAVTIIDILMLCAHYSNVWT